MADAEANLQELLDHAGWLQDLARRVVGEAGADDAVQEVYLRAARRPPTHLKSARGWLWSALASAHLRRLERREAAAARERDAARAEALPSAAALAERAEAQRWLVEAVLQLSEPERQTLLLRFFEGLSAAEIARRSGVPSSTVRTRVARGLALLRERLEARPGGRASWLPGLALLSAPREGAVPSAALGVASLLMGKLVVSVVALVAVLVIGLWWQGRASTPGAPALADVTLGVETVELGGDEVTAPAAPRSRRLEVAEETPLASDAPTAAPARSVRGVVLDPAGRAVAGATVFEGTHDQVALSLRLASNAPRPSAETGEDGGFELELGERRGALLCARAEGFAPSEELALDLLTLGEEPVTLRLRAGASVVGRVYGIDQEPAAERIVQVSSPDLGEFHKITTDHTGHYEVHALNPGPWRAATFPSEEELEHTAVLGAVKDVFEHLQQAEFHLEDGEVREVVLGLVDDASPRVTGRLLHAGEPVGGLMQWYPAARPAQKKVSRADAEGRFAIDLPEAGAWIVHANVQGGAAPNRGERLLIELEPGARRELEIDLRGADLSGRALDAFGLPVAGVQVELRSAAEVPHQPPPTIGGGADTTDEEGRFAFALVAPGEYFVVAKGSRPGQDEHGAVRSQAFTVAGLDPVELPDLTIPAGQRFEVLVQDVNQRPVAGASLYFHDVDGHPLNPTTLTRSNGSGAATSPAFAPGPVWVTARHRRGASASVAVEVGVQTSVTLALGRERWIELDVEGGWVDPTREHVAVVDGDGRRWGGLVDPRGLFDSKPPREVPRRPLLGPLPRGEYTIQVERPDGSRWTGSARLGASSPRITTVTLR